MRRELANRYELDDDPTRIDAAAVHDFLSKHAYWAKGRTRATVDDLIARADRVVGLYHEDRQVGFSRTLSDGLAIAYLADVYVLPEHRGRGLGVELVRFSVDEGPFASARWVLNTDDAHELYRRFGFAEPDESLLVRGRRMERG